MIPATAEPAGGGAGLLAKLMAAVRPEFRAEVLVPDGHDSVLGIPECAVVSCDYPTADHGICNGHRLRWRSRGRPPMAEFLADPGPPLRGRAELSHCTVDGCRYGPAGHGLCLRHRKKWERAGRPDTTAWVAGLPAMDPAGRLECRLPFCTLWTESSSGFLCRSHDLRWRRSGRPDIDEFIAECERLGKAFIDFRGLPPQLKLELQYAVQLRSDTQTIPTPPRVLMLALRWAAQASVASLLDHSEEQLRQLGHTGGRRGGTPGRARSFLVFARDAAETLRDGAGWEVEYARDIWRLSKLPALVITAGQSRDHAQLRFDRIAQPWLRDLAKRWIHLRLTSGLNVETVVGNLQGLTQFSEFLTATATVHALNGINRSVLERFLAWLAAQPAGPVTKSRHIGGLHLFFEAIRRHGWDDRLPTTAVFFTDDYPKRPPQATRHLAEHVMNQLEQPANLDRWSTPEGRLVTVILIRCGLRVSDACTLAFDCLLQDGQGAPYLRYLNNKMHREAAVPIDEELEAAIRAQQRRVLDRWPGGTPHLFPRSTANVNGQRPLTAAGYRGALKRWLATCDIRDEHRRPVHLTPHQWRHTFVISSGLLSLRDVFLAA